MGHGGGDRGWQSLSSQDGLPDEGQSLRSTLKRLRQSAPRDERHYVLCGGTSNVAVVTETHLEAQSEIEISICLGKARKRPMVSHLGILVASSEQARIGMVKHAKFESMAQASARKRIRIVDQIAASVKANTLANLE